MGVQGQRGGVEIDTSVQTKNGIPTRVYVPLVPSGKSILWLHGGGFTGGSFDDPEGDGVARTLAAAGSVVATVEYRHADPTTGTFYPVPSDDVLDAWEFLSTAGRDYGARDRAHLGGASAGGNLAVGAALRLRDRHAPLPASLLLAYPTLHARQRPPSAELSGVLAQLPARDRWTADTVAEMYRQYLGDHVHEPPAPAVPGTAVLTGLPPVFLVASEIDGLRASAEEFAEALHRSNHPHEYVVEPGALHGQLNTPEVPQCATTLSRLVNWLDTYDRRSPSNQPWPRATPAGSEL